MQEYQERVMQEKKELDEKIEKLNAFTNDPNKFNDLPSEDRVSLTKQEEVMMEYSKILGERIARF